jgi:glycosyltransferase involved in cell wall biosynthesis
MATPNFPPSPHNELANALVSVVVPVFNEEAKIIDNLDLLISQIEENFLQFEIIVVSDGSTDGTNLKLAQFQDPNVRFKIVPKNSGKGNAVREGFKEARGDFIFFIDGGMELHPKELRIFIGLMSIYNADIVIGSKRHPQSKVYYPWYRRFLSALFQLLIRFLFKIDVSDTQVGIKLFKRDVLKDILPYLEINRYGFDLEILSLANMFGHKEILEAPIRLDYFVQKRAISKDLLHVLKVGMSLLVDTFKLHSKLNKLQRELREAKRIGPKN